jgi:hypothetical protein
MARNHHRPPIGLSLSRVRCERVRPRDCPHRRLRACSSVSVHDPTRISLGVQRRRPSQQCHGRCRDATAGRYGHEQRAVGAPPLCHRHPGSGDYHVARWPRYRGQLARRATPNVTATSRALARATRSRTRRALTTTTANAMATQSGCPHPRQRFWRKARPRVRTMVDKPSRMGQPAGCVTDGEPLGDATHEPARRRRSVACAVPAVTRTGSAGQRRREARPKGDEASFTVSTGSRPTDQDDEPTQTASGTE